MSVFKTYKEYRNYMEKGYNALPIFWAFTMDQFEEQMKKRGLTSKDTDKICRFANVNGGFFLKSDADKIRAWFKEDHSKILHDRMESNQKFAREAFEYEMANFEYPLNWEGDYEVCSVFGSCKFSESKTGSDYLREMGYSDKVIKIYNESADKICRSFNY